MTAEPRSLGDFTSEQDAQAENPLDGLFFTLDGQQFSFSGGHANLLKISELAEMAVTGTEGLDEAALMAGYSVSLRAALGEECADPSHPEGCPGEYARFAAHVDRHKTPPGTLTQIAQMVNEAAREAIEAATSRPTQKRSGSPAGPRGRGAQLSRLIAAAEQAGEGEFAREGEPQEQPPPPPDMATIGPVRSRDGETDERALQEQARQEARSALLAVKTRPQARTRGTGGSRGRRTA